MFVNETRIICIFLGNHKTVDSFERNDCYICQRVYCKLIDKMVYNNDSMTYDDLNNLSHSNTLYCVGILFEWLPYFVLDLFEVLGHGCV